MLAASVGTYTANDELKISYDAATVRYYKNGTLLRRVAVVSQVALHLDSSFFTSNAIVNELRFGGVLPSPPL